MEKFQGCLEILPTITLLMYNQLQNKLPCVLGQTVRHYNCYLDTQDKQLLWQRQILTAKDLHDFMILTCSLS